jgi:hypothetical protein
MERSSMVPLGEAVLLVFVLPTEGFSFKKGNLFQDLLHLSP